MGSLSNRQSILRPTSGRQAVAQLGLAQQPLPRPVSGRFLAAHLGVGRTRVVSVDVLARRLPAPVAPAIAQFYRLRDHAQRLQEQLAAHDRQAAASAPVHGVTPKEAGYPIPFLTPAEQAHRRREADVRARLQERLLAQANQAIKYCYLPSLLVPRLVREQARPGAKPGIAAVNRPRPGAIRALTGGDDCFMPLNFWKSQNPTGAPGHWTGCAITVYAMLATFYEKGGQDALATHRYDLVLEHRNPALPLSHKKFVTRDAYMPANAARATQGMAKLDAYMAAHRPVMVGVSHTINFFLSSTNKKTGITTYHEINNAAIDHFIALVGTGVDKKGKYYRFFDVGTQWLKKGTDASNRFYLGKDGYWRGKSAVGHEYVLVQLRF